MPLSRIALKNLEKTSLLTRSFTNVGSDGALSRTLAALQNRSMGTQASHEAPKESSNGKQVAVQEGSQGRRFSLFPRRQRRRSLWRRQDRDFAPTLSEFFPSSLGHALMQATENINRLFENMNLSPFPLSARIHEKDDHYKLKYNLPGLSKEDVKVVVHDGLLEIRGEHKEEKEHKEDEDDDYWSESSYGYCNSSLLLPEDAKADGIKAEMKDGVLTVVIPRTERTNKEVKEVEIH